MTRVVDHLLNLFNLEFLLLNVLLDKEGEKYDKLELVHDSLNNQVSRKEELFWE